MINVLVWKTFLSKTFSYFPNKSKIIILTIVLLSIICFDEDLVFGYFSYTVLLIFAIACKMMKNTPLKLQNVNSQTMSQFIVKKKNSSFRPPNNNPNSHSAGLGSYKRNKIIILIFSCFEYGNSWPKLKIWKFHTIGIFVCVSFCQLKSGNHSKYLLLLMS